MTAGSIPATQAPASVEGRPWRGGWRDGASYGRSACRSHSSSCRSTCCAHFTPAATACHWRCSVRLLSARLLDAIADPFIGRWADALYGRSPRQAYRWLAYAAVGLAVGFRALFFPPMDEGAALLVWCAIGLVLTYLSFSTVMVIHQAWGARLAGDELQRARIVAWREGFALAGVMIAGGLRSTTSLDAPGSSPAARRRRRAAGEGPPRRQALGRTARRVEWLPWQSRSFRRLLAIYLFTASPTPCRRPWCCSSSRSPRSRVASGSFLGSYFAGPPRSRSRSGCARSSASGSPGLAGSHGSAIATFGWATQLGRGDVVPFLVVCLSSGIALGADLTLPSAMLTGVIQRAGHGQQAEGSYFGWWSFATKLNLALAAGLALPALQALGYAAGVREAGALAALTGAYCLLPCALKLIAAGLLYFGWIRAGEGKS